MRIRRFVLLKSFLFLHGVFPVRKSIFRKSWLCIRWSSALKCFQASMAISSISSLVIMQPLKSFKPYMLFEMIFLLDSYCRRSLPQIWNSWAGMDYPIRSQRLDLEDWVVSLSLPVCQLCCEWLQIIFISALFFDWDCFFEYTRLWVTST